MERGTVLSGETFALACCFSPLLDLCYSGVGSGCGKWLLAAGHSGGGIVGYFVVQRNQRSEDSLVVFGSLSGHWVYRWTVFEPILRLS